MEPLDQMAASRAFIESTGRWSVFSHHARAGRIVVAIYELEQAIRWACARCGTAIFELKGLTTSTCAVCARVGVTPSLETSLRGRCGGCGAEHDRHANAACVGWQHTRDGLEARLEEHAANTINHVASVRERGAALKAGIAEKRRLGRAEIELRQKDDRAKR